MNMTTTAATPETGRGKARRFVGASVREVYAQVRAELGPDALILEQRSQGGRVEVLAGLEVAEAPPRLARELLLRGLRELGLGARALAHLPATIQSPRDVELGLGKAIPCSPPPEPLCGTFRFIGPPGAGKTTALIKLAASRVLRYGPRGTLLIGTDRSRLAGCEQLASSAELLGVEYLECAAEDLPTVLRQWRHMQLVLIDTAGTRDDESGAAAAAAAAGVDDVLVLPAVWHAGALRRLLERSADRPPAGLVLTHADQAHTLWECAGLLLELQLPVWWVGHSGDLAAELERADGNILRSFLTEFDRSSLTAMFQDVA